MHCALPIPVGRGALSYPLTRSSPLINPEILSKQPEPPLGPFMARKLLDPIPPGEILYEEFMQPLELSINALAREIHVPPNRISDIVNGKRGISADTALRLGKYFGV